MFNACRKQREEREAERQSRLRLAKRLEVLRPTASVSGKQDCAETTPVMFDLVSNCHIALALKRRDLTSLNIFLMLSLKVAFELTGSIL